MDYEPRNVINGLKASYEDFFRFFSEELCVVNLKILAMVLGHTGKNYAEKRKLCEAKLSNAHEHIIVCTVGILRGPNIHKHPPSMHNNLRKLRAIAASEKHQ